MVKCNLEFYACFYKLEQVEEVAAARYSRSGRWVHDRISENISELAFTGNILLFVAQEWITITRRHSAYDKMDVSGS